MIERIPQSFVLVEIDSLFHEKILFNDGRELLIDPTYEPEKHLQTSGIVHTVPDSLYFNKKDLHDSMEYDVPIEIQKGDRIFFHYLQLDEAIKRNKLITIDDKLHAFIRYDRCFCVLRGENFITLNGWMLLEPYGQEEELTSQHVETKIPRSRRRSHPLKGKIAHLGTPVQEYLWSKHETDRGIHVEEGDVVMFTPHSDIPLEYDMHQKLNKIYYRVQRKDLLSKLI